MEPNNAEANVVTASISVDKLLTIKGHINDVEGRALLDTGSSVSVISLSMVRELNIKYGYSDLVVNTIINKSATVLGMTEELEVNIKEHCCLIRFYVLDNKYEMLLGLNWFEAVGAGVSISTEGKRILKFSSDKYDLDAEEALEDEINDELHEDILSTEIENDDEDLEKDTGWQVGDKGCKDTFKTVPETKLTEHQSRIFLVVDEKARNMRFYI